MLELIDQKLGNSEVVIARGRLDSETSHLLEAHCRELLGAGCTCLVFDFNDLQFLSSEGLRTLLGLAKRIRASGGKLIFAGVRGPIHDLFDIAGFLDTFPVVDQVEPGMA